MDLNSNNINNNSNNNNNNFKGINTDNNYVNGGKGAMGNNYINNQINQPINQPQYIPQNNNQNFWNNNLNTQMQQNVIQQQYPAQFDNQINNEKEYILLDGSSPNKKRKYMFIEEIDIRQPIFSLEDIRKIISDEFDRRFGKEE